jgi:type VI secretion system protein ImpK
LAAGDEKTIVSAEPNEFHAGSNATAPVANDSDATILDTHPGVQPYSPGAIARVGTTSPALAPPYKPRSNAKVELRGQSNAILSASNTLIAYLSTVGNSLSPPVVAQLQKELATEIGNLDSSLKRSSVRHDVALSARYILCAALDEAILNTTWGAESDWNQNTLLQIHHYENSGAERFFSLLDQLSATPQKNHDLLELFYIILCMGFKGRYRDDPAGDTHLEALRERLHQDLCGDRPYDCSLSDPTRAARTVRPNLRHQLPLWIILSVALALTLLVYSGLRAAMDSSTVDIARSFDDIYPLDSSK